MNARVLYTVLIPVLTLLAGSDIIKAEILTDFEIDPNQVHPEQENMLHMKNVGIIQADNVVVLILANNTITKFTDLCAEGQISHLNSSALVVEFLRMSPGMQCMFKLDVLDPVQLDFTISSDGRLWPWNEISSLRNQFIVIFILVVLLFFEIFVLYRVLQNNFWQSRWYWLESKIRRKSLKNVYGTKDTIRFVKEEYDVKISKEDATILTLIYNGKVTINQLIKFSDLPSTQINYIIKELRNKELILQDTITIGKTLYRYFERGGRSNK